MSTLRATLLLYRDCARDAARGLARGPLALVALFLATPVLVVAATLTAPMGFAGGFLLGFLHAVIVGWYLSLVEIGVVGHRKVALSDLTGSMGTYLWEVISVLFIFWIASMLLMGAPTVHLVAVLVATLVFNPVPEMIYQERSRSLAMLGDAAKFMQDNWPEWLGVHALAGLLLLGWGWLVTGGLEVDLAVHIVQIFGPWFEFIDVGSLVLSVADLSVVGIAQAIFLLVFVHWFMIFRGHLYARLKRSSRRSREWASRH